MLLGPYRLISATKTVPAPASATATLYPLVFGSLMLTLQGLYAEVLSLTSSSVEGAVSPGRTPTSRWRSGSVTHIVPSGAAATSVGRQKPLAAQAALPGSGSPLASRGTLRTAPSWPTA